MSIAEKYLPDTFLMPSDLQTSGNAEHITSNPLTSSLEDSRAKTFPLPGLEEDWTETAVVYGGICSGLLASYDHDTSLWKTLQLCLYEGLNESLATWPRADMTQNGKLYALIGLEQIIQDAESSLLPTMRASRWKNAYWCSFREDHHSNLDEYIGSVFPSLVGQPINLQWLEWHMGFPIGWTDSEGLAMR